MFIGLLTGLFVFLSFILAFFVLLQSGKSGLGFTGLGGGAQMLFGGSGGQEIFQKITWGLLALFMFGSMSIAILKTKYATRTNTHQQQNMPMPSSDDLYE